KAHWRSEVRGCEGSRTTLGSREGLPRQSSRTNMAAASAPLPGACFFASRSAPTHRAIRPFGPTAQPNASDANATLLYAVESTDVHDLPPSRALSVPVAPT